MPTAPIIFIFLYMVHMFWIPQECFLNEWIPGCGGAGEGWNGWAMWESLSQHLSARQGWFCISLGVFSADRRQTSMTHYLPRGRYMCSGVFGGGVGSLNSVWLVVASWAWGLPGSSCGDHI